MGAVVFLRPNPTWSPVKLWALTASEVKFTRPNRIQVSTTAKDHGLNGSCDCNPSGIRVQGSRWWLQNVLRRGDPLATTPVINCTCESQMAVSSSRRRC